MKLSWLARLASRLLGGVWKGLAWLWRLLPTRFRPLAAIIVIVGAAVASLAIEKVEIPLPNGEFKRGSDDILGLQLGLDLAGGSHLVYQAGDEETEPTEEQMVGLERIIRRRVDKLGASEPNIQRLGNNRILIQLPGVFNVQRAKDLIGQTASLEIIERVCDDAACNQREDRATGLTGENLSDVFADRDSITGENILRFRLTRDSIRTFAELTQRLYDSNDTSSPDQLAFFLDGQEQVSARVRQPILTGTGQITGNYTVEEVRDLAINLESGRLPISITVITERVVDASLGSESLEDSLIAGIIGLALVLFFMSAYYRGAGVVAAISLIFYTAIVLAVFKLVPVTLILACVAGFILSMGMAVDANVLIFERMKEELRAGRTLAFAIQIGFRRAWPSIRDGNISTFIIAAILFWFGTTFTATAVTSFAVALFIGVATSMFSALFISRNLLLLLASTPLKRLPGLFSPEGVPKRARETRSTARPASEGGPS